MSRPAYGIDARNLRRQRFAASTLARHLRFAREVALATLICYLLLFAGIGVIWFLNSLIGR